jgi:hypothetical protein
VFAPMSLERTLQVLFGEDRKSRSSDCFSVLALLVFWPHSVFGQNHLCVKML